MFSAHSYNLFGPQGNLTSHIFTNEEMWKVQAQILCFGCFRFSIFVVILIFLIHSFIHSFNHSIISLSAMLEAFQSRFSTQCNLVLPLSV